MHYKVISNAHSRGGGELSFAWIAEQLAQRGHFVEHHPIAGANEWVQGQMPNVVQAKRFDRVRSFRCDVVIFYANDTVYKLNDNKQQWRKALDHPEKFFCVINFTIGHSWHEWFASRADAFLFLNSNKHDEWFKKQQGFLGKTYVLPPPVNIERFLSIPTNYDLPLRVVRHSRVGSKYDEKAIKNVIQHAHLHHPKAQFNFLPLPKFYRKKAPPFVKGPSGWDGENIPRFLGKGNVFWYMLPGKLRDQGPRVIVEAMASGLPCIVDNRDGPADRVTQETGWLCDSREDHRKVFEQIKDDPGVLSRKGVKARERAEKHFRPERWIDIFECNSL